MASRKTIVVEIDDRKYTLMINKSGVIHANGQPDAVGYMDHRRPILDLAMLMAVTDRVHGTATNVRSSGMIGSAGDLIQELRRQRDRLGNKGGGLYGVLDLAAETIELGLAGDGWAGEASRVTRAIKGYFIVVSLHELSSVKGAPLTMRVVSGQQHDKRGQATKEMISCALHCKKAAQRFIVMRMHGIREMTLSPSGNMSQFSAGTCVGVAMSRFAGQGTCRVFTAVNHGTVSPADPRLFEKDKTNGRPSRSTHVRVTGRTNRRRTAVRRGTTR